MRLEHVKSASVAVEDDRRSAVENAVVARPTFGDDHGVAAADVLGLDLNIVMLRTTYGQAILE